MNYESPIEIIMQQMNTDIENEVFKAVQNIGINVCKYELLKALSYDRDQYQKGYNDRDLEIVRCRDCRYCVQIDWDVNSPWYGSCQYFNTHSVDADGFCYKGEKKGA